VVIYQIRQPADLEALYRWVGGLEADKQRYARPITVMDRKTHSAMGRHASCFFL
jgi:hypothetical protein